MSGRRDLFCLCFLADCTGIGFYSCLYAGWFLSHSAIIISVVCFWCLFFFCLATDATDVSPYSRVFTGGFRCYLAIIPCMVGLRYRLSGRNFGFTIGTIGISCIALCLAGCFFFVTDLGMLVSGRSDFCCFCLTAGCTGIGLCSGFRTGRLLGHDSAVPAVGVAVTPLRIEDHVVGRIIDRQFLYSLGVIFIGIPSDKGTIRFGHVPAKRQVIRIRERGERVSKGVAVLPPAAAPVCIRTAREA